MYTLINKSYAITFFLLISSLACISQKPTFSIPHTDTSTAFKVDLLSLIKNIDKYDKKWVETSGNVIAIFEIFSIIPDEQIKITREGYPAIWLDTDNKLKVNSEYLNGKKFLLRGKVNVNRKGHMGQYQGTLENIYYLKQL